MAKVRGYEVEPRVDKVKLARRGRLGIAEKAAQYHPDVVDEKLTLVSNILRLLPSVHLRGKRVAHAKGISAIVYYSDIVTERIAADAAELGID